MNNTPDVPVASIVREYFPDADDDQVQNILWNYTGYPGFWDGDPATCLREQLQHLKLVGFDQMDAELNAAADKLEVLIQKQRGPTARAA